MAEERSVAVDALFLERLEALFEKSLADLRAFAQRERCSFEEVRKRIAEWHCQYLFEFDTTLPDSQSRQDRVHEALRHTSTALESLQTVAGLQSFFVVVHPNDPSDEGFLGGTMIGREFWRDHRGCGTAGARAFKLFSEKSNPNFATSADTIPLLSMAGGTANQIDSPVSTKKGPAGSLKAEVYSSVRNALRKASGIRTAEMKWSNHAKLDTYGVRLVGWPVSVPMHNPSSLSVVHNQSVLDALRAGIMSFVPLKANRNQVQESARSGSSAPKPPETNHVEVDVFQDTVDFSWAGDDSSSTTPLAQGPSTVNRRVESHFDQPTEPTTETASNTASEAPPVHISPALFVNPSLLLDRQTPHQRKRRREDSGDSQESPT